MCEPIRCRCPVPARFLSASCVARSGKIRNVKSPERGALGASSIKYWPTGPTQKCRDEQAGDRTTDHDCSPDASSLHHCPAHSLCEVLGTAYMIAFDERETS